MSEENYSVLCDFLDKEGHFEEHVRNICGPTVLAVLINHKSSQEFSDIRDCLHIYKVNVLVISPDLFNDNECVT